MSDGANSPPVLHPGSIELHTGQAIHWPPAPGGIAQVESLGRTRVRLVYRCRTGTWRHPLVCVASLAFNTPPLPLANPLGRGVRLKSKRYPINQPKGSEHGTRKERTGRSL